VPGGPSWGEEPAAQWGVLGVDGSAAPLRTEPGAYPRFYAAVAAAVRTGSAMPVDPEDAIAGLDVIEAAQIAAARGGPVELAAR